MTEENEKKTWDRGLDYYRTEKQLRKTLKNYKDLAGDSECKARTLTKVCALYTQLVNGSRISEACEALKKFHETGDRKVKVRIAKQSEEEIEKRGYVRYREMWIPDIILTNNIQSDQLESSKITAYCINVFGFNTHSLRYAFVGMMSNRGIAPQLIAKITGHRDLQRIIDYSQDLESSELHYEVVFGKKRK